MDQPTEKPTKHALMITETNHISACRSPIQRNYLMLIYYFLPFLEVDWLDPDVEPDFPVATPSGGMTGAPGIGGSFTGLNVASLENLTYPLRWACADVTRLLSLSKRITDPWYGSSRLGVEWGFPLSMLAELVLQPKGCMQASYTTCALTMRALSPGTSSMECSICWTNQLTSMVVPWKV